MEWLCHVYPPKGLTMSTSSNISYRCMYMRTKRPPKEVAPLINVKTCATNLPEMGCLHYVVVKTMKYTQDSTC